MADKKLMIDTSILIDYFRKSDKEKSRLVQHFIGYQEIYISCITEFEIFNGATDTNKEFWDRMLSRMMIVEFDSKTAREAAKIVLEMKVKRKTRDKPDLFIAATAIVHDLHFDTLNIRHFAPIDRLKIISLN